MRRSRWVLAGAVLGCVGLAAPAWAASPTTGDDVLHGTAGPDEIEALAGDDTVYGHRGRDWLRGQAGDDSLYGGAAYDVLAGGDGRDLLVGGPGPDSLHGGQLADELRGGIGNDVLVPDGGRDTVTAGAGDDEVYVRNDGLADRVDCGGGFDWVEINLARGEVRDPRDTYVGCEDVYVDREGVAD